MSREEIYAQIASWFKFPYRNGTIKRTKGLKLGNGCEVCGGRLVYIRAQYPGGKKRKVCPTCAVEILESLYSNLTNRQAQKSND